MLSESLLQSAPKLFYVILSKESGVLQQCLVSDFLNHGDVGEAAAKDASAGVYLG